MMLNILLVTQPGYVGLWALRGDWTAAALQALGWALTILSAGFSGPVGSFRVVWTRRAYILALIPVTAITVFTWSGLPSLLAGLGLALGCISRWQTDHVKFRRIMLATNVPWLLHDLMAMSAPALAADLFGVMRGVWVEIKAYRQARQEGIAIIAHTRAGSSDRNLS